MCMAITERDYLLLRDENKTRSWMLLKSGQHFHLVRVDASLTEQKYKRLMKRYPCGMKTFQELGLSVTPINREKCTHVMIEEGERLTMHCSGNVRRFILGDRYSVERLEAFFDGQQVQWRVVPEPEGPDARTTKVLGWSMSISGVVMILMTAFMGQFLSRFRAVLGLVGFAMAVVLCVRFPGRFAIGAMRHEDRSTRAKYRFDMELALYTPLVALALDALRVTYTDILMLVLWGAVLGLSIGILLTWASRGYRSTIAGAIGLTLGLMLLSGGIVAQVNQLADFGANTVHHLTVDRTEIDNGGRGGVRYECLVTMPNGEQEQFDISWTQYRDMKPGDPITIVSHEGALGLEYLTIDWQD